MQECKSVRCAGREGRTKSSLLSSPRRLQRPGLGITRDLHARLADSGLRSGRALDSLSPKRAAPSRGWKPRPRNAGTLSCSSAFPRSLRALPKAKERKRRPPLCAGRVHQPELAHPSALLDCVGEGASRRRAFRVMPCPRPPKADCVGEGASRRLRRREAGGSFEDPPSNTPSIKMRRAQSPSPETSARRDPSPGIGG